MYNPRDRESDSDSGTGSYSPMSATQPFLLPPSPPPHVVVPSAGAAQGTDTVTGSGMNTTAGANAGTDANANNGSDPNSGTNTSSTMVGSTGVGIGTPLPAHPSQAHTAAQRDASDAHMTVQIPRANPSISVSSPSPNTNTNNPGILNNPNPNNPTVNSNTSTNTNSNTNPAHSSLPPPPPTHPPTTRVPFAPPPPGPPPQHPGMTRASTSPGMMMSPGARPVSVNISVPGSPRGHPQGQGHGQHGQSHGRGHRDMQQSQGQIQGGQGQGIGQGQGFGQGQGQGQGQIRAPRRSMSTSLEKVASDEFSTPVSPSGRELDLGLAPTGAIPIPNLMRDSGVNMGTGTGGGGTTRRERGGGGRGGVRDRNEEHVLGWMVPEFPEGPGGPGEHEEHEESDFHDRETPTVAERLKATIENAEKEEIKYTKKASTTGFLLNAAIGMQVFISALITALSAVTSGHHTQVMTSVLGGAGTVVASYLARARGSNEPELSIARVKDLQKFIRECVAFVGDHGNERGRRFDRRIEQLRMNLEHLLGNGDGERRLAPIN